MCFLFASSWALVPLVRVCNMFFFLLEMTYFTTDCKKGSREGGSQLDCILLYITYVRYAIRNIANYEFISMLIYLLSYFDGDLHPILSVQRFKKNVNDRRDLGIRYDICASRLLDRWMYVSSLGVFVHICECSIVSLTQEKF